MNHSHLEELLTILYSEELDLRVNPQKCAIFAVHGHEKINSEVDLPGIPITTEYCYLGVTIDHSGSINPQLDRILQKFKYLKANMRYYV